MTAARSDLMALADQATLIVYNCTGKIEHQWQRQLIEKINKALRLAASQPDREAVNLINERLEDLATANALYGKDKRLSAPEKVERNNREISWLKDLRSALLSGAGTKSDGSPPIGTTCTIEHDGFIGTVQGYYTTREGKKGVNLQQVGTRVVHVYGEKWLKTPDVKPAPIADSSEAGRGGSQALREVVVRYLHDGRLQTFEDRERFRKEARAALSAPVGEPFGYLFQPHGAVTWDFSEARPDLSQGAFWTVKAVYTHPPAPAVGADVREALETIASNDGNADQAVAKRALELIDNLSALTRPLGGFVQGSIARKQSTDTEGSSRTETAGGA